jgi:hypothetical protein
MTTVRVDLYELYCQNQSDEIGIAEDDEVYVIATVFSSATGKTTVRQFPVAEDVDDGAWVIPPSKKDEHSLRLAQTDIAPGHMIDVLVTLMEQDGGRPKGFEKRLTDIAVAAAVGGELGAVVAAVENLVDALSHAILDRGDDDVLGMFNVRVWNRGGVIEKEVVPLKYGKIRGYKKRSVLSSSKKTLRLFFRQKDEDGSRVEYGAAVQVRNLEGQNKAIPWTTINPSDAV